MNNALLLLRQKDQTEVIKLNVQKDHVHLVAGLPPKYAVSDLMGFLKGKLATKIFAQYPQLGRKHWGRQLWVRGYCVSTAFHAAAHLVGLGVGLKG